MDTGHPMKQVLKMTWPIFVELLLQMLIGNVDQFMISRYSQNSVAAIGNANQIINFLTITFSVLCTASIILITQYKGAKNEEVVSDIYSLSLFTNLVISIAISLLIFLFSTQIFHLMAVPAEVLGESRLYLLITGSFLFLPAASLTFSAFLRSNTLMKQSMIVSVVMNILNIAGNALLINGFGPIPALGVAGVAISSTVSRAVAVVILVRMFIKHIGKGHISPRRLRPFPKQLLKRLLGIGLPSAGESFAYNSSQLVIQSMVNLFGTVVITAKVYCSMLAMVSYIFASAISQASQVIEGHMLGARQVEQADRQVRSTLRIAYLISTGTALLLYLFAGPLLSIFTSNPETIALCKSVLLAEVFLEMGRAFNIVFVRALQTAGDIKFPVTLGVLSTWIIAVGLGYVFGVSLGGGLVGIWIAMALDELTRAVVFYIRWRKGGWKMRNLIGAPQET